MSQPRCAHSCGPPCYWLSHPVDVKSVPACPQFVSCFREQTIVSAHQGWYSYVRAMQQRQADALLHVFLYVGKGPDNRLPTNIRQRKAPGSGTSSSSHTPRSHADGFQVWEESSSEEEELNDAEAEQTEAGPSLSGVHTPAAPKRQRNSTDTHSGRQSRRKRHSNATDTSRHNPSKCGAFRQGSCHTTLSDVLKSLGGGGVGW